MKEYDVVIIGSGPGGYVCAIRCAQLGMKTAIIEKYSTLGGTCLNVGCIPSKAWLDSSERYHQLVHNFKDHGILADNVKIDFPKMSERVQKVVADTSGGIQFLMKKNKIDVFQGHGSFIDPHTIEIKGDKTESIKGKKIVIATGSKPSSLRGVEVDKKRVITSTEALKMKEIPKHLIVIGGGVIGVELGSVFARLGSQVSVVEYADSIIATMDADMGKNLQRVLTKEGMKFYTGHGVTKVENDGKGVVVLATQNKDQKEVKIEGDYCLVCVGRRPYTDNLGLEKAGLTLDERGRVPTDDHLQTSVPHIFAIGDVTKGAMLAHKAEEEGVFVAELMAGQKPHINYLLVPGVVYTWPEVASVGHTEAELKKNGVAYKIGSFPFKASGRARASNESDGLIKVLADKNTDEILGVHMIGPRCADMIAEAVLAMEYRASAEDVARTCHAHPTYTESFKEACLAATENRALHI
ncbi:MAG: dihydrolipoyl dehydrogenase [Bdellovibrio sp. CG12_big_fil_rev_8_21_14_0_65_39_13]|nr:MAG: dihydrolipoyl dehydrogenase [Bdellovibrio sp. CG22_combo_CG10-13_8_21_14_all_39_27]PIQ62397.1 MAG: dihydrolipoyl dehydrogenase [Bdellovibrio sp. CG12_big_fil_rev_8_21_14_0_65_39_13]PIR34062.1 MAG: dihydrolipoyl dehydrogenase [Bdellovibrio sp. CG11_big_fil_rev_8_21_14_0_20_39_38]